MDNKKNDFWNDDYRKQNLQDLNDIIGNVNKNINNIDERINQQKQSKENNEFKKNSMFNENKLNFNINNRMDVDNENDDSNFKDNEIMNSINSRHTDIKKVYFNRKNSLKRLMKFCLDTDVNSTINYLSVINELPIYHDFLNYSLLQTEVVKIPLKLDNARFLLTPILDLVNSKYDNYKRVGLNCALVILKLFSERIITTKGYPSFGIDLNKEERIKVCDKIIEIYRSIKTMPYLENLVAQKQNDEVSKYKYYFS